MEVCVCVLFPANFFSLGTSRRCSACVFPTLVLRVFQYMSVTCTRTPQKYLFLLAFLHLHFNEKDGI